ncbi:MAG: RDD family protein [Dermatophilaceae bacterium]
MSSSTPDPYQQPPESPPPPPGPPPPAAPGTAYQPPASAPPPYQDYVQPPSPGGYGPPPQPGYGTYPGSPYAGGYAGYPGASPMAPAGAWGYPYAHWGYRVLGTLIDYLYTLPGLVLAGIGAGLAVAGAPTRNRSGTVVTQGNSTLLAVGVILAILGALASVGVAFYNLIIVQGRTGQSWGKRHIGLRIIHEHTGRPLSMGMNFVRYLCHYIDGILYLGYLWPLWDPKRQTFADKIMTTVVVKER